jgi:hypothetical protein
MPAGIDWLPPFVYRAGRRSVSAVVNPLFRLTASGGFLCPPEKQGLLHTVLRDWFAKNLCRKQLEPPTLVPYDPARRSLRLGAALQMATAAFRESVRAAKPEDKAQFADRWAAEALAYVIGKDMELAAVTAAAATALAPIRESNIHRDRRDLVSGAVSECLAADKRSIAIFRSNSSPLIEPYLQACRESLDAFSNALEIARSGRAVNHKPFSQHLIKGAVLAQAAEAVLRIGRVSDAIAEVYAQRLGTALPYMSCSDVFVAERDTPDFGVHPVGGRSMSSFVTGRADATVLDVPHVAFRAAVILLDPRWVAHEFRHVRQQLASDCRLEDLSAGRDYPDKATELEAKIEEAEFVRQFGVLF